MQETSEKMKFFQTYLFSFKILTQKNIIDDRKSHVETSEITRRFTTRIDVSNSSRISRNTNRYSKLNPTNKIVQIDGIGNKTSIK